MIRKMFEHTSKTKAAINKWKEHNKLDKEINEKNYEKIFASIYAFRNVVNIIDAEILESDTSLIEKCVKITSPITISDGDINANIHLVNTTKYRTLAEVWAKLDDIRFPARASIEFIDEIKLRYANYMGFIYSIIDYDYITYEVE